MRVFFDASVIIAALLSPDGGSAQLFRYVRLGVMVGITSQTVLNEVISKTAKINKLQNEIEAFIVESKVVVRRRVTKKEINPYTNLVDAGDAHLIAGAKLTRCVILVTLDKRHLLRQEIHKKFLPLMIVSPRELLQNYFTKST